MSKLSEAYEKWLALQPFSSTDSARLGRKFMLDFNYNSNHIEGNTLTYGQTEVLLLMGEVIGTAKMKDLEDMKAHNLCLNLMIEEAKAEAARAIRDPLLTNLPAREILAFRPRLAARIIRFGFPAGLNVLVGSATFTVFTLVLGRLGPLALAVSNAVFAIGNIYYLTATAIAQAVTITTARARGCGDIVDS